ncbi:hypothetical protein VP01_2024g3 [Puccinia sorghi]|uniref:Uncharacterized protein n=1 Tax=Puccinia sorghi TaxID=27349 RepID=A0A0L6VBQ0_9BASI|nr:hypothetical protein VP01_2024g3 [Puccinia sorghi]
MTPTADTEQLGVLVGEKAVAFLTTEMISSQHPLLCAYQFAHSNLPPTILGEIWQLADQDNAGFLTRQQFDIALRLIGKAQRGLPVNEQAIFTPGPLCRLKGYSVPGLPSPSTHPATRTPSSNPLAVSQSAQDPLYTISNEDKMKYSSMFFKAGPRDGLLDGEKARDIFIRSKLSFEKLGQIWTLADTQSRGALSVSDFCIAMHLIQLSMSGRLSTFPTSLPPALLDSATASVAGASLPISRQVTGQHPTIPGSLASSTPLRQSATGSMIRPQYTGRSASSVTPVLPTGIASIISSPTASAWDISSAELAQSNIYFDSLDTNRLGYITGDQAVPFMMESKLSGEILARIWDLADIRGEGKLNREEFAVAMRLIQDTLAGGADSLAAKLPLGMVPPSSREPTGLPVIPGPLMSAAVNSPSTLSQGKIVPQTTGQSVKVVQFSSSRGLGEDDGAKLGNVVNQLSSTESALSTLRDEKSRLETETGSTVEQIKALELKLFVARQAHQSELPLVEELRRRQTEQRSTISKLTGDVITAESELSTLKLEKEQIEGNILRDKEEIRDMKKRMAQLEEETQRLKSNLEILKKDSRLQKGLIAIGKKQVLTVEGQRGDISKEIDTLTDQIHSVALSAEGPQASNPGIPAQSVPSHKSTNPFERMMPATSHPEPSGSRDLNPTSHGTAHHVEVGFDPFSGASDDPAQPIAAPSPNTISFGDAFGLDSKTDDNNSPLDHGGFHDALETTSPDPSMSQRFPETANQAEHPRKDESDESSDEDEIEDPIARHLAPPTRPGKAPSFTSDKFPALEDVEASIESKAVVSPPLPSQDKELPIRKAESSTAQAEGSSGGDVGVAITTDSVSTHNSAEESRTKPAESHKQALNFGDDLEVSDFVADFGLVGGQGSSVPTMGTALDDFDSAFENFPSAGTKTSPGQEKAGPDAEKRKANEPTLTGASSNLGFDGFDDAFVVMDGQTDKKDGNSPLGFEESFSDFDKLLASGGAQNATKSHEDPFGSPASASEPPPLPTRPTSSIVKEHTNNASGSPADNNTSSDPKIDPAKPTDSDAVKQICAMGFDRQVVIQALERDDWDMDRALNHLLGT